MYMTKNSRTPTYSIEQVKAQMEQYVNASAERLRARLRKAWKKQASVKQKVYDKAAV
jgi:hypothetical protein